MQINMEDTAGHETVYKLTHRAAKANFSSECDSTTLTIVQFAGLHRSSNCRMSLMPGLAVRRQVKQGSLWGWFACNSGKINVEQLTSRRPGTL